MFFLPLFGIWRVCVEITAWIVKFSLCQISAFPTLLYHHERDMPSSAQYKNLSLEYWQINKRNDLCSIILLYYLISVSYARNFPLSNIPAWMFVLYYDIVLIFQNTVTLFHQLSSEVSKYYQKCVLSALNSSCPWFDYIQVS